MFQKLSSQKGFGAVLFLALCPVIVGALLAIFTVTGFIQFELRLNHMCRQPQLSAQAKAGAFLKKLLALNPKARSLRAQERTAEQVAKATPPGNVAYAAAQANLARIRVQRALLAVKQQELIRASNQILELGSRRSRQNIMREQQRFTPSLRPLLMTEFQMGSSRSAKLAVSPDKSDIAPVYAPAQPFADRQALEQTWQYRIKVHPVFKPFLDGNFQFQKGCAVTLQQEGSSWVAKIHKVRFLPKWL